MLHFDWTISLGQIVTVVTLLGMGAYWHKQLVILTQQHGLMWNDYSARHGLDGAAPMTCAAHGHQRDNGRTVYHSRVEDQV